MRLSSDRGKGLVSHNASEMGDFPSLSSSSQRALITAMQEPSFYPKGVSEVGHKETHISHLFFGFFNPGQEEIFPPRRIALEPEARTFSLSWGTTHFPRE